MAMASPAKQASSLASGQGMTYSVKECFYTLQGEGVQAGRAAGALTLGLANNPGTPVLEAAQRAGVAIYPVTVAAPSTATAPRTVSGRAQTSRPGSPPSARRWTPRQSSRWSSTPST